MGHIDAIANLLTEDPDVLKKSVVLAVHPNFVIDAITAAASEHSDDPSRFGPHRLKMFKNYIGRFRQFVDGQLSTGSGLVITLLVSRNPDLTWHDPKAHWDKSADLQQLEVEQAQVQELYEGFMQYLQGLTAYPNVMITKEEYAGSSCEEFGGLITRADEVQVIGGNLSGCMKATLQSMAQTNTGPKIRVIPALTFDDDSEFWERNAS